MIALCLGYSRIVQRRVLPALQALPDVTQVEIASRRGTQPVPPEFNKVGKFFDDFDLALRSTKADFAYVSTINSDHRYWAQQALSAGLHVIVDKPAFLGHEEASSLCELASSRSLCLAEATVYVSHPQIDLALRSFTDSGVRPTRITAVFSMPGFDTDDFRYRADQGGGALWDLGPYAVSIGRVVFEAPPTPIGCSLNAQMDRPGVGTVETAFSMMATFPTGGSLIGHFGFDTQYENSLHLLGPGMSVAMSRVFTTPPDHENTLQLRSGHDVRQLTAPAADSFAEFFGGFIEDIRAGNTDRLAGVLLADAAALDRLRAAATTTNRQPYG